MSMWIKNLAGAALLMAVLGCGKGDGAQSTPVMAYAPAATPATTMSETADAAGEIPARSAIAGSFAASVAPLPSKPPSQQFVSLESRRSVIRKAQISLRVTDLEKAEKALDRETSAMGGYVDATSTTDLSSDHPQMDVTVRVPAERFDAALSEFESLGTRLAKSVSSEDVTGQLVDLDARMRTLGVEEETYRGLLRKVVKIGDIISLQDKLTEVRSQLESMASERKTLGSLASSSTIEVHLERSAEAIRAPVDPTWVGQVWGESTTQLGGLFRGVCIAGIWFVVFCPVWIPLAFLIRRAVRAAVRAPEVKLPPVQLG